MWSSFWWISELNDVWTSHVFKTRSTFEGVVWNKQNGFIQKDVSVCFCCRKQISKRQVKSNGWMFIRPWHWLLCFLTRCDFRSSTYEKSTLLGDFRNIFNMLSFAELMRLPPNANVIGHSVSILFSNLWFHLYIYIVHIHSNATVSEWIFLKKYGSQIRSHIGWKKSTYVPDLFLGIPKIQKMCSPNQNPRAPEIQR